MNPFVIERFPDLVPLGLSFCAAGAGVGLAYKAAFSQIRPKKTVVKAHKHAVIHSAQGLFLTGGFLLFPAVTQADLLLAFLFLGALCGIILHSLMTYVLLMGKPDKKLVGILEVSPVDGYATLACTVAPIMALLFWIAITIA
jgi:hypothetical protein